jgi:hypothetical protein
MGKTVSRNVAELPAGARQTLEGIIEAPLEPNEHVIIMTYTPGAPPDERARQAARTHLAEIQTRVKEHQQSLGVSPEEVDAACDEAIEAVRNARRV